MTTKKPPPLSGVYDPALDEPELTPAETAAAIQRAAAAKRALRHYLELVQQIPEVVEVRQADETTFWTVTSAPGDDAAVQRRVIKAQGAALKELPESVPLELLLVNRQRIPHRAPERTIDGLGALVWRRSPESAPQEDTMPISKTRDTELAHHPALRQYLELIREIPEVVEVRLRDNGEVFTIISDRSEGYELKLRVIHAQGLIMQTAEAALLEFHLVNYPQLPPDGRAAAVRGMGAVVWRR